MLSTMIAMHRTAVFFTRASHVAVRVRDMAGLGRRQ